MQVVSGQWSVIREKRSVCSWRFNHYPPSTIHYPLSRHGISLLEVLISIFILTIGLLGVAALIPIGKLSLVATNISDRTGACGRAGLREVKVRRMLDYNSWDGIAGTASFAIDPLGYTAIGSTNLGGAASTMPRISLNNVAPEVFYWGDDLPFVLSTNGANGDRPVLAGSGQSEGNFSWFLTVTPAASEAALPVAQKRSYSVSVVVCHKRNFTTEGEQTTNSTVDFLGGIGYGGGTIQFTFTGSIGNYVKNDQWVMLVDANDPPTVAKWYRVVGVGDQDTPMLSLVGPDWNPDVAATLVVVEGVTGVYTTTVELDNDLIWTR